MAMNSVGDRDPSLWNCKKVLECVSSALGTCTQYKKVIRCVEKGKEMTVCTKVSRCRREVFTSPYGSLCAKWETFEQCKRVTEEPDKM